MLSPEDLVDLGLALRDAEVGVATQQCLAAEHLLLRLAAEGALPPNRAALESYLAPIFCSSAVHQRRFGSIYRDWLRRRFPGEPGSPPPPPPPEPPPPPRRHPLLRAALVAATIVALVGIWFSWQHFRPRIAAGVVMADGAPVAKAQVTLGGRTVSTDADGRFEIRYNAAALPAELRASSGSRVGNAVVDPELYALRSRLYFGTPIVVRSGSYTVSLQPAPPERQQAIEPPRAQRVAAFRPEVVAQYDAGERLQPPSGWQRLRLDNIALIALPLLLFAAWYVRKLLRRPVLQRRASTTPPTLREVHLPGGARAVVPGFPLRRLAQELRRRRSVDSMELQVEATVEATLAHAGVFTVVRGSRAEPDYFALIDRSTLSDHQARLASEIVADLARSDVLIERYDFDRDATVCRPRDTHDRPKLHPTPQPGRAAQPRAVALADLQQRYSEHRIVVFSDGAEAFDGFTGKPAPWLETLLLWPLVAFVTPLPADRWGRREAALLARGVFMFELSAAGLGKLMELIAGSRVGTPPPAGGRTRAYERAARRWLERDPPSDQAVRELLDELRDDLGARGFAWLAGCAAYPEVHWGITLRLGPVLVADPREMERLLPRIASLPWFRVAYMPDWLRAALLDRVSDDDDARIRESLRRMLESVATDAVGELPLVIATGEPQSEDGPLQRLWQALRRRMHRQSVHDLVRQAGDDSPLQDYVFLRFLSGRSLGRLDFAAPGAFAAALRTSRRTMLAPASLALAGCFAASGIAWTFFPPADLADYHIFSRGLALSADGSRVGFISSLSAFDTSGTVQTRTQQITLLQPGRRAEIVTTPIDGNDGVLAPDLRTFAAMRDGAIAVGKVGDSTTTLLDDSRGDLTAIAFSEDAAFLAAGYRDGATRVWDVASAKRLFKLTGHTDAVVALAFSPGNTLVATGSGDMTAIVSAMPSGSRVTELRLQQAVAPYGLLFSPSAAEVATAAGNAVAMWDVRTGRKLAQTDAGKYFAHQLSFDKAGNRLAIATTGPIAIVWSWRDQRVDSLPGHAEPVARVAFSPDGALLATIDRIATTRLWDAAAGSGAVPVAEPLALHGDLPDAFYPDIAFSDDSRTLAAAYGGEVAVWRLPAAGAVPSEQYAGVYHGLIVANDYRGAPGMPQLRSPLRNADIIGQVLQQHFGFRLTRLENQTRVGVLGEVDRLTAAVRPDDSVLLYLDGTGTGDGGRFVFAMNPGAGREFDLKQDGVSGDEIIERLRTIRARNVLVVGDASYVTLLAGASPSFSRGRAQANAAAAQANRAPVATQSKSDAPGTSRVLIASYTKDQPFDSANAEGSPFAVAVATSLRAAGPGLTARALFDQIGRRMSADKDAQGQRPSFFVLRSAGDTGGTFTFPDPIDGAQSAVQQAATQKIAPVPADQGQLPALAIQIAATTVSGVSSGAYMATQFHVAHSSIVRGAAMLGGGPYYCAQGDVQLALGSCAKAGAPPDVAKLASLAGQFAKDGRIDALTNLKDARVWLFAGARDSSVSPDVVRAAATWYSRYMPSNSITLVDNVSAGGAMVTRNYGAPCGIGKPPYIENCNYDAAGVLLQYLYGSLAAPGSAPAGELASFDQRAFASAPAGLGQNGYVYVPRSCVAGRCRVHVVFHGCQQDSQTIGDVFVRNAGYNRWADTNEIVVLYPQAARTPSLNPSGCWDWWGYTGPDYATKSGAQIRAVRAMVERLAQTPQSLAKSAK